MNFFKDLELNSKIIEEDEVFGTYESKDNELSQLYGNFWQLCTDKDKIKLSRSQMKDAMRMYDKNKIPEFIPDCEQFIDFEIMSIKEWFNEHHGFSLVTKDWIRELAKLFNDKPVLEILAGTGLISQALREENIKVISTDNMSWENGRMINWRNHKTDIENLDAVNAIEKYGKEVDYIIMAFPPYEEKIAYDALIKMREVNPNAKMIYIGENFGGCCADDVFFETLDCIDDVNVIEANLYYPRFCGMHDRIYLIK